VAGCCECGDEPSGSCATELVSYDMHGLQWDYSLIPATTRDHMRATGERCLSSLLYSEKKEQGHIFAQGLYGQERGQLNKHLGMHLT
jgi:hypothetical protein